MSGLSWFDFKISIGNVISWVGMACVASYGVAVVHANIENLDRSVDKAIAENLEIRREIEKIKLQRNSDWEAFIEIRADLRSILRILESHPRRPPSENTGK